MLSMIVHYFFKIFRLIFWAGILSTLGMGLFGLYTWRSVLPELPSLDNIKTTSMAVPLRIYSADQKTIAEFGEERRIPLKLKAIPPLFIKAILAAEDARFYEHLGVDFKSLMRASLHLIKTADKSQGGSTITMQLARNIFTTEITRQKTFERKIKEILISLKLEKELSKEEILELYLNKIFLGHHAYGVGAAAQVYYAKPLQELSLAEFAMIAALPKAPSALNPITNPKRALERRNYVLQRMLSLGFIKETDFKKALEIPVETNRYAFQQQVNAPYLAEMVRAKVQELFPKDAYTAGYKVYTTLQPHLQEAAQNALRKGLMDYDTRHGFRGALAHLDLKHLPIPPKTEDDDDNDEPKKNALLDKTLKAFPLIGNLQSALVLETDAKTARLYLRNEGEINLSWEGLSWAARYIDEESKGHPPKNAAEILKAGDVVMVLETTNKAGEQIWRLSQIPQVAGSLVSLNPNDGSIIAIAGGFDFNYSKFNHVTQAKRQPGSTFKPFIYSAALDIGYTPASVVMDAPLVFNVGNEVWTPENYGRKFAGEMRLRSALAQSRNLVSIRLMVDVGLEETIDYVSRFGFDKSRLPPNFTLALGTPELTPLEMAKGFAVFANGGFLIEPYFIEKIETIDGKVVFQEKPRKVCMGCSDLTLPDPEDVALIEKPVGLAALINTTKDQNLAPRVIDAENAWMMYSLLQSVILEGTARRAKSLNRKDIAGKTGTTNDLNDAWFCGFNTEMVAVSWMGFDQPASLGQSSAGRETGGVAALPMWMDYMRVALENRPEKTLTPPSEMTTVRINPQTGLVGRGDDTIVETLPRKRVPTKPTTRQLPNWFREAENSPPVSAPPISSQSTNNNSNNFSQPVIRPPVSSQPDRLF